jgi:glyoxylase-like metal-dependent hydrolase (beta-lactamase superfamily II)
MLDEATWSRSATARATTAAWCPPCRPLPRLIDGMQLTIGGQAWRCIAGYGHAPEHMALY